MGMTKLERGTRSALARFMRSQGYVTYAKLLLEFDLNFFTPKDGSFFAARMIPGQGRILINPVIDDKEALSTLIRHEILHEYLKHQDRLLKHLADSSGLDYDKLDDLSLNKLKRILYSNKIFNIAADYEISNRGYTENDKDIVRNMGQYLHAVEEISGLVTEDDHPEWTNLSVEDMYDRLNDEMKKAQEEARKKAEEEGFVDGVFISNQAFYDPRKNVIYGSGVWENV